MATEKPICQRTSKWLKHHCGERALAPLTGQDSRALTAFTHLLELYAAADTQGANRAVLAMAATVCAMQPSVRHLAKRTIPQSLDWNDEEALWQQIQFAARDQGYEMAPEEHRT